MPIFSPNPNVVEVVLQTILDGRPCSNSFHVSRPESEITEESMFLLSNYAALRYRLDIVRPMNNKALFTTCTVRHLNVIDGYQYTNGSWGGFGQANTELMPNCVALRINFETGVPGRSTNGCNYILGIDSANVNRNYATDSFIADMIAGYERIKANLELNGWQMGVYSKSEAGIVRTIGQFTPLTGFSIPSPVIASLGRRLKRINPTLIP